MQPIKRAELIWITVPAGTVAGASLPFLAQPTLEGVDILGAEMLDATGLSFTPDLVAVITAADRIRATLTLAEGSDEVVKDLPLTSMNAVANAGVWKEFDRIRVDWQKSYVKITQTFATLPCQVPFVFYYARPEDWQGR